MCHPFPQTCCFAQGIRQAFETRCNELREAGSGAEARAQEASSEVLKGNRIIERLSSEVRAGREKSRRKGAIISRQEEELLQRDRYPAGMQA